MKIIRVSKKYTDEQMEQKYANTFVKSSQIDTIFNESVDIYSEEGELLVRFRKGVLPKRKLNDFYDATYDFTIQAVTGNRGQATGSKTKDVYHNPRVYSAILGYFDRWAPKQKIQLKQFGEHKPLEVRETRFSMEQPHKYKQIFPLVQRISQLYHSLLPDYFKKQNKKAKQTLFKIPKTCFTTITTNINFQTSIHKDRGDDEEGFGNLAVMERGKYEGGETCLPQYGFGVNVREGDLLFMNVHEWHGNLPIVKRDKDAVRMSIVCYLRKNVWARTKHMNATMKKKHLNLLKDMKFHQKTMKKI